jgi:hypothetical protein
MCAGDDAPALIFRYAPGVSVSTYMVQKWQESDGTTRLQHSVNPIDADTVISVWTSPSSSGYDDLLFSGATCIHARSAGASPEADIAEEWRDSSDDTVLRWVWDGEDRTFEFESVISGTPVNVIRIEDGIAAMDYSGFLSWGWCISSNAPVLGSVEVLGYTMTSTPTERFKRFSGNTTAGEGDSIFVYEGSGGHTLTLPDELLTVNNSANTYSTGAEYGRKITIKNLGTGPLIVAPGPGTTVDGSTASFNLNPYASITVVGIGATELIIL